MKTKVLKFIEKYNMLTQIDHLVVGVSGGADSVCLLFLLCDIISSSDLYKNVTLDVVHVNHGIRSEASQDAEYVRKLCSDFEKRFGLSITYHLAEVDVLTMADSMGLSTEEMGRIVRYDAMNKVLPSKKGNGAIAVAHNANDQSETIVFNLFRGSGLKGVSGISPVNGNIIRPLLEISREDIEKYLNSQSIDFVIDKTNLEDDYTRNKIRHHIIEYSLNNISSSIVSNITSASNQLRKAESFIEESTLKAASRSTIYKDNDRIDINIDELSKEHEYIVSMVIYEAIAYVAGRKKDITNAHVESVLKILTASGSKKVNLPYGIVANKEYNILHLHKKNIENQQSSFDIKMDILEDFDITLIPVDNYTKWFDYDKISSVAKLRTRKEGDYLTVNDKLQKKSLKDYFINEKIPKDRRDDILLLADDSHIMWVIGMRISEYYKVTEKTKKVLEVKYVREN